MDLLVIRHAIAEDRDKFAESGRPDDERPLTGTGRRRMERAARGLGEITDRIDLVATSPLVRAVQTADIIRDVLDAGAAEVAEVLRPQASPEDFERWAAPYADKKLVAIVGHEPHLGSLVTWLIRGRGDSRIELRKGGACLVSFDRAAETGKGTLVWLLTPRVLRKLA